MVICRPQISAGEREHPIYFCRQCHEVAGSSKAS